jgi:hypothetical protein
MSHEQLGAILLLFLPKLQIIQLSAEFLHVKQPIEHFSQTPFFSKYPDLQAHSGAGPLPSPIEAHYKQLLGSVVHVEHLLAHLLQSLLDPSS